MMKHRCLIFAALLSCLTVGCASTPSQPGPAPSTEVKASANSSGPTPDKLQAQSSSFIQDDLKGAAAYATANGYPARAAVYTAMLTFGAAIRSQAAACKAAIEASLPTRSATGPVGLFTAFEMAAEAVGSGIPAAVKVNCEPIPIPNTALGGLRLLP